MSTPNNRRRDPGGLSTGMIFGSGLVGLIVVGLLVVNVAVRVGHRLAGTDVVVPSDPFAVVFDLLDGDLSWPGPATWLVAGMAAVVVALAVWITVAVLRARRRSSRVDSAARYMGRGKDIESLSQRAAQATAQRLGVKDSTGVPIGKTLGGASLFGSYEDMHVDIWGPRTGKTTSRVVPAILAAPGAVLATSNKRDAVDATRDVRAEVGDVWVFDPQGIALEEPTWWWNPLSYVTDEVKAARLAEHFASGGRAPDAKTDAYFDPAGQDLLAGLLLAAAIDGRPITAVYTWLTMPWVDDAVKILRDAGYPLTADQVAGVIGAPEKQRGGVYGTAMQMASCLTNRRVAAWVTPKGGKADPRPHFDPAAFVTGRNTLYSLSLEGQGTAGPLVTALTVAVVEAAEELATRSPGGRLATPLVVPLDEAANVCRWRALPNLYSHYGSRGIIIMTILQSWSQGVEVWGESGMKKLWSASNIKCYGGGVDEDAFLEHLSKIVGDYDRLTASLSTGRGQRTVSQQLTRDRILSVDALAAMPKGRAVVFSSGNRPVLIRTQPWMTGAHAEKVRASIKAHDPAADTTLAEAAKELATVEKNLATVAAAEGA